MYPAVFIDKRGPRNKNYEDSKEKMVSVLNYNEKGQIVMSWFFYQLNTLNETCMYVLKLFTLYTQYSKIKKIKMAIIMKHRQQ